jgi:hypothetical protein
MAEGASPIFTQSLRAFLARPYPALSRKPASTGRTMKPNRDYGDSALSSYSERLDATRIEFEPLL